MSDLNDEAGPPPPAAARPLADRLFGNSPFLARLASRSPAAAARALAAATGEADGDGALNAIIAPFENARPDGESKDSLMAALRQARNHLALLVAAMDVADEWPLEHVTAALSRFADAAVGSVLGHLLAQRMTRGDLPWPDGTPEAVSPALGRNCGLFVLALGKLGGGELNYSSDIDLIVLFDPERSHYQGRKTLSDCMIRITRDMVDMLERRTGDGYVFRTDLRLRPDPGATPVALSVDAAESYYHSLAASWERAAMIKARPIAGDITAATTYLDMLSGWVWRRSMDFSTLDDIASIKTQLLSHYGQKDTSFEGFDVKLGRGGIREVEFFAQINQLLFGGREPSLQEKPTCLVLDRLVAADRLEARVRDQLVAAYEALRRIEHRLQMIDDAQTHSIPESADARGRLVHLLALPDEDSLRKTLGDHTRTVHAHYQDLLPDSDGNRATAGPDLPGLLTEHGFTAPDKAAELIEGWRRGRYRAVRTERARRLLNEILPDLLAAMGETASPDDALSRFDKFLSQLPAGVQLFSLLQANPGLFRLLARVMGLAPALADRLARKPTLWDHVLDPDFFSPIPDGETLHAELVEALSHARDYQDSLDITRQWVHEHKFRIGVHMLESLADVRQCCASMTRVADAALTALIPETERDFERRHGRFPGGGIAVLAMGKYGGGELTHTSDLDIVFLYQVADGAAQSDGDRPLSPSQYFSRLGQNILTALTALTPEGPLFEVDTRLRPSGAQGPLVVTLKTFEDYYTSSAWTWEHMALTRARPVLVPDTMRAPLKDSLRRVLTAPRDADRLVVDVANMRARLFSEFGTDNPWSVKHVRGGLVDIEFICQYLMLKTGHREPEIFTAEISDCIRRLSWLDVLMDGAADTLNSAHWLQQNVQAVLRLSLGTAPNTDDRIPPALRDVLCRATGMEDFATLKERLVRTQEMVHAIARNLIETPAERASERLEQP
ncbi:bifunctional [glutamine synthetase] adenylyltransferase/[glutamine synthetase]-adenylyl-L-tyrosine phosphorylase [Yunchengibacter salinarum]|uniref:bifunctional [glutamine synthetase] adenylyltransferase/[glutamine synthetase]-adenylyl-L-tyrosine phosphorylase n=1 Tax=Yunchengibacter salinarum TaxID=3133399 RepID=UPI0035B5ADD8